MSAKRKIKSGQGSSKKLKKNGKRNEDDLSDFDDEFQSDLSNDGSASAVHSANEDGNEIDDLPAEDESLRVKGPDHIGTFLVSGCMNWDLVGRKTAPKGCKTAHMGRNLFSPHKLSSLDGIRVRVVVSGPIAAHSVIITEEWKAMTFGRNERGQLGSGDMVRKDTPLYVEDLKEHKVVGAACGRSHTLFLTDRGTVYACGDNKMGQCGSGNGAQEHLTAVRIRYKGPPIVKVVCGADFSVILDCKGTLRSFGSPEYGQLGHNTNGEYIGKANKISFMCEKVPKPIVIYIEKTKDNHSIPVDVTDILDVACGTNHTVALDSRKRVFSWGFGGYGRLGHADTKDEMVPRQVKFFDTQGRGVKGIACGSSFSVAYNEYKMCYLFGQTKKSGEANMYPKPIQDLSGWSIRSFGCGYTCMVLAADNSVIAFGPSPAYGELCHGEHRRSTTQPLEVRALDGIYVEQVACGMHHSMMVARDLSDAEKEKLNALPVYKP
ncbi:protein RCC2 [Lycorma delicatula]|uniref:protein RCC2 n=1 Tax=Lycorma delicatula TaxID=130591 RepID=UPI003F511C4A